MIDLVYPLGPGSRDNDFEIYHSLRLVKKFMVNYKDIYIIGAVPPVQINELFAGTDHNIIHVPAENRGINNQDCIRRKVEIACNTPAISHRFLFMNDDFFLRGTLTADVYPFYYYSNLGIAYQMKRKMGHYKRALGNTLIALATAEKPLRYYDIHVPIIYNKTSFLHAMSKYDWKLKDGYVIKSLYVNTIYPDVITGAADNSSLMPHAILTDANINHYCNSTNEIESFIPPSRNIFAVGQNGLNDVMKQYIENL